MNTFQTKLRVLFGLVAILFTQAALGQDKSEHLAIIVSKASKLEDVSLSDLQKYFKAEKTKTPDGTKIAITMMDVGRPERDAALKYIYKMNENDYTDFFVSATFTGAVQAAPKAFPSAAAMKKFVGDSPGAIGYLRSSDVDENVKAIKVDGKSAGDADYPLKLK